MTFNHTSFRWSASLSLLFSCAFLVCSAPASAQSVTTRGVQCGDHELTFDELSASTATAVGARLEEIKRTIAYFNSAWSQHGPSETGANRHGRTTARQRP
jgi:hypothetical protein